VVHRLGYVAARGSSTRGGGAGALEMIRLAREGRALGITPDGPRGPALVVKPGLALLAARAGLPVIPAAAAAARARVLDSWDRFRVPWPFTRVHVAYGEPIEVPRDLGDRHAGEWAGRIGDAITAVTRHAASQVGETA
jgi:lysophospholipid acyltransferase (LPLAT)-like uncharacterized protein